MTHAPVPKGYSVVNTDHGAAAYGFVNSGDDLAAAKTLTAYLLAAFLIPANQAIEYDIQAEDGDDWVTCRWQTPDGPYWFYIMALRDDPTRRCHKCGHPQTQFTCSSCGEEADSGFNTVSGYQPLGKASQ